MGFLNALKQLLGNPPAVPEDSDARPKVDDDLEMTIADKGDLVGFDREQWRRKLRKVVEDFPESKPELALIESEARALGFEPSWTKACCLEEFTWMVRRAVCDRVVSPAEHLRLDEVRGLLGISESEATAILSSIVDEAETLFDGGVQGV